MTRNGYSGFCPRVHPVRSFAGGGGRGGGGGGGGGKACGCSRNALCRSNNSSISIYTRIRSIFVVCFIATLIALFSFVLPNVNKIYDQGCVLANQKSEDVSAGSAAEKWEKMDCNACKMCRFAKDPTSMKKESRTSYSSVSTKRNNEDTGSLVQIYDREKPGLYKPLHTKPKVQPPNKPNRAFGDIFSGGLPKYNSLQFCKTSKNLYKKPTKLEEKDKFNNNNWIAMASKREHEEPTIHGHRKNVKDHSEHEAKHNFMSEEIDSNEIVPSKERSYQDYLERLKSNTKHKFSNHASSDEAIRQIILTSQDYKTKPDENPLTIKSSVNSQEKLPALKDKTSKSSVVLKDLPKF